MDLVETGTPVALFAGDEEIRAGGVSSDVPTINVKSPLEGCCMFAE